MIQPSSITNRAIITPTQRHDVIDRMATLLFNRQPKSEAATLMLLRAAEFPEWQIADFLPTAIERLTEMKKGTI